MLIPIVLSPKIFKGDSQDERIADNIGILLKTIKTKGVVLYDSQEFLESEIPEIIAGISDQNLRKKYQKLFRILRELNSFQVQTEDFSVGIHQNCEKFLSILKSDEEVIGFCGVPEEDCDKKCIDCMAELLSSKSKLRSLDVIDEAFMKRFEQESFTSVVEYDIEKLQNDIFKNFVKYSKEIYIYDNQLIPNEKEQNNGNVPFVIKSNYKLNIEHLFSFFYSINPALKINLYLPIKQEQIRIKSDIIREFEALRESLLNNCPDIKINLLPLEEICDKGQKTCLLHQRYFISEHLIFSCDRGLDLLKNAQKVRDFNISIVDRRDECALRKHFKDNMVVTSMN